MPGKELQSAVGEFAGEEVAELAVAVDGLVEGCCVVVPGVAGPLDEVFDGEAALYPQEGCLGGAVVTGGVLMRP